MIIHVYDNEVNLHTISNAMGLAYHKANNEMSIVFEDIAGEADHVTFNMNDVNYLVIEESYNESAD